LIVNQNKNKKTRKEKGESDKNLTVANKKSAQLTICGASAIAYPHHVSIQGFYRYTFINKFPDI
jgi:hypothetical protein